MVAPEVRSSGSRSCVAGAGFRPSAFLFLLMAAATAGSEFDPFPGERPEAGEAKEWLRTNRPKLTLGVAPPITEPFHGKVDIFTPL